MENKINIAEILKDCPKGTKLYSPLCGKCYFDCLNMGTIICKKQNTQEITFTSEGYYMLPIFNDCECVLFPSKENRDWSKFQRPFKDGDILTYTGNYTTTFIYRNKENEPNYSTSFYVGCNDAPTHNFLIYNKYTLIALNGNCDVHLATKEEKQKLFQAIKANGYKWNEETKTLEELPKFKVGDKIVHKAYKEPTFTITEITDTSYKGGDRYEVLIEQQDNFELAPSKFDISILKPFDKVLVRDDNERCWNCELFDSYRRDMHYQFNGIAACYKQCIPYEENKHLLGTTNDCDEYYKTWE